MCHVQRVINTCGHRNDHVFLLCHFARAGYQLAVPISDPNSNLSRPNTTTNATSSTTTSTDNDHESSHHQDDNDNGDGDGDDAAFEERGFHACTEPYCVYASVRTLDSPVGFRCMVEGCGRTAISVHQHSAYKSPTNFHAPDHFIPERWLPEAKHDPSSHSLLITATSSSPFPWVRVTALAKTWHMLKCG